MHRPARSIDDYEAFLGPLATARAERSGKQPGDPAKAAEAIIKVTEADNPSVHLLLGPDAGRLVREKLKAQNLEIDQWEAVRTRTNFTE
jgi:hypothetical protein